VRFGAFLSVNDDLQEDLFGYRKVLKRHWKQPTQKVQTSANTKIVSGIRPLTLFEKLFYAKTSRQAEACSGGGGRLYGVFFSLFVSTWNYVAIFAFVERTAL